MQSLTRPNGSVTTYQYNALNQLLVINNKTSSDTVINKYTHTYNNADQRDGVNIQNGLTLPSFQEGLEQSNHNEVNQIITATNPSRNFMHDADGNMTVGYTPDGYEFSATYDAEDRLKSIEYTDDQAKVHKREYVYRGDWMLAQIKRYEDGVLVEDKRIVRTGFLASQERDESNNITRQYAWGLNMGGGVGGLLE